MASGEKVNWRVPSDEWQKLLNYVHDKYGETSGYVTREVESAIREWVDKDGYEEVEEKIDRLIRAAGRTSGDLSQKKSGRDTLTNGGDTTKVQTRVHPDLKGEFRAVAKQSDDRVGIQLAKALRARREGGRSKRLEEKLDRIVDDAEGFFSELDPDPDDPDASLSLKQKRTIAIQKRLGGGWFTEADLREGIEAVAGGSKPTIRDYKERVIDRMDYVPHPNNSDLYIPKEEREGMVGADEPAVERKDYGDLTRGEKIRGIQIKLARKADNSRRKAKISAGEIKQDLFGSHPTDSHTYKLMQLAAAADGYDLKKTRGSKHLRVNLPKVDSNLLEESGVSAGQSARKAAATDGGIDQ